MLVYCQFKESREIPREIYRVGISQGESTGGRLTDVAMSYVANSNVYLLSCGVLVLVIVIDDTN